MPQLPEYRCTLCIFGFQPHLQFEPGGLLDGLKALTDQSFYLTERAQHLFNTMNVSPDNLNYFLGELPDGRWVLLGLIEEGCCFALETDLK